MTLQVPYASRVILDLSAAITDFHEATARAHEYELYIDEFIELILEHVNDEELIQLGISALASQLDFMYGEVARSVPPAAITLAKAVVEQLQLARMYGPDGSMRYALAGWFGSHTPILIAKELLDNVSYKGTVKITNRAYPSKEALAFMEERRLTELITKEHL